MWSNQQQEIKRKAPNPTPEEIAETLNAPDEFLWSVRRRANWGAATLILSFAVLVAVGAIVYIGGQQAFLFSGLGGRRTPDVTAYFVAQRVEGITLAQIASRIPQDWLWRLSKGAWDCWHNAACQASVGPVWADWRTSAGLWFPELMWAVRGLQWSAGGLLIALVTYLFAMADVSGWQRWERQQRLAARRAQRHRQRKGG